MSQIEIFPDPPALARAAAERIVALAAEAITARGQFSVGPIRRINAARALDATGDG